jgi:2-(1,2-epoxy-1,2-dihydrophenyl)acetyl-CoA isomerase
VDCVQVRRHSDVAVITLNRPQALNALVRSMGEQALAALHEAVATGARSIVLTGVGRAFCAGADLAAIAEGFNSSPDDVAQSIGSDMLKVFNPLSLAIAQAPIPVVCAVNGPCVGGGVGLALAADIVIAARSAYFLVPQVASLGVVPDLGATWELPRAMGRARALGAMLLGERMGAEQAQDWGLIWQCVDDAALLDQALSLASRLANVPAETVQAARQLVDAAPHTTPANQLDAERALQVRFLGTAFFRERVARFLSSS